jgi:thioredoxin
MTRRPIYGFRRASDLSVMISTFTANQFPEVVEASRIPVLIDFFTEGCGHCRDLLPVLEEIATEREQSLRVVKFDAHSDPAFAAQFRIRSVPNLILFQGGVPVGQRAGYQPKRDLEAWIDSTVRA